MTDEHGQTSDEPDVKIEETRSYETDDEGNASATVEQRTEVSEPGTGDEE